MKDTGRIIGYIALAVVLALMLAFLPQIALASEVDTPTDAIVGDLVTEDSEQDGLGGVAFEETTETDEADDTEYETLFTRIFEFVEAQKELIVSFVGFVAMIILTIKEARARKNTGDATTNSLASIFNGTKAVFDSQSGVVDATNNMLQGCENLRDSNAALLQTVADMQKNEAERDKVIGALAVEVMTVLEILASFTANNKNLPQGVKDANMLRYSKCLASLESDETLRSCIAAIRGAIGATEENKEA
jgi:hypothetical protein